MATQTVELNIQPLERRLTEARRWLWLQRAALTMARAVCASLVVALVAALLAAWQAPAQLLDMLWAATSIPLVAGLAAALLLRPSFSEAARAMDDSLGLAQQIGTAEELLTRGAAGGLVHMQISRATDVAQGLVVSNAFPLLPRKETRLAALLAAATGLLLLLVSLGVTLPNPLTAIRLPLFGQSGAISSQQQAAGKQKENGGDTAVPKSPALDPVQNMLNDLRSQARGDSLSKLAASAAISQASAELNRVANQSRMQQQALDNLSNELQNTAAGRSAAESLRQGDYQQAAEQIRNIGQQSDQLSQDAKQQLADALNRAARNSPGSPDLAKSESQAAQAMEKGKYSDVTRSMDQLGQSVEQAASQMVSQAELAQQWQQLEQLANQLGSPLTQNDFQNSQVSPPVAQAPQNAQERSSDQQQGAQNSDAPGSQNGQDSAASQSTNQPGAGQSQAGNQRGGPLLGDPNAQAGTGQNQVEVGGKVGDRFTGDPATSDQPPSVLREGTAGSSASGQQQTDTGPISVPAENVFVPGDQRPVVRDYFSKGSTGQ